MLAALGCSGCTAAYVSGEAIASNKAVEAETNSTLVTNILRARDGVPTYYSDISHLRGSLQAQASISAPLGIGDYKNWTGRSLVAPGAYVQVNPSFDVAPLNTQGFTKGINEPLDVRVFQYYLDRAIPPYTLLELFVDKIEGVRYEGGQATRSQDGGSKETQAYQVIRVARNTVGNAAATVSESVDPSACVRSEVYAEYETPDRQASGSYTVLHFRSVDGMVEFLGRMLRVPPRLRPLRFDLSPDDPATSRFSVPYEGRTYHVHDRQHRIPDLAGCPQGNADPRCEDRTLEILTLVNQLLNLNKNQNELPATGAVQVVN